MVILERVNLMKAVYNGFLEIRGESSETKPAIHTTVEAYDAITRSILPVQVSEGDCFIETNTQNVLFMTSGGWN